MNRHIKTMFILAVLIGLPIPAQAALTLSFGNAVIAPGGTAELDVTVTGDGDEVALYNFDFRIVRDTGSGNLQFAHTQDLNYRTESNNYVFGEYGQHDNPQSTVTSSSGGGGTTGGPVFGPYQQYRGSDSYLDLDTPAFFTTVNGPMLLARLQFIAPTGEVFAPGSTFKVYYVHAVGTTDYSNEDQKNFDINGFGTITVQAVPEPAAVVSVLSGLAIVAVGQGWRRRRDRRVKATNAR